MSGQIPLELHALAEESRAREGAREIAPDLAYLRLGIVNAVSYGSGDNPVGSSSIRGCSERGT